MSRSRLALYGVLFAAWAGTASAGPLVQNGNFGTGDFIGWSLGGTPGAGQTSSPDGSITIDTLYPNTGDTYDASFSAVAPGGDELQQTITDTSGQKYTLQFALTDEGNSLLDQFTVSFGGSTIDTINGIDFLFTSGMYAIYALPVTGTGSDILAFQGVNELASWNLDDVTLDPVASGSVPEPSALLILASGLLLMAGYRGMTRRKQMP